MREWCGRHPVHVAAGVTLALALLLTALPTRTLYSVSATTERVAMTLSGVHAWELRSARLVAPGEHAREFTGFVQLRSGATVTLQRMDLGAVRLDMKAPPSADGRTLAPAQLFDENDQPVETPTSPFTIEILAPTPNEPLTLTMQGDLRLEGPMTRGTYGKIPMLRSGAVTISAASMLGWGAAYHFVGSRDLSAGDDFRLDRSADGRGFLRIEQGAPGLTVVYSAVGWAGQVVRLGHTSTYDVSPWDRVQADAILRGAWAIAGTLMTAALALPTVGATTAIALLALLGMLAPATASAQVTTVHLITGEHGIGTPRWWAGGCYVTTPAHVVAGASEVEIVAASRRSARAEIHWQNPALDVAVLRVTAGAETACATRAWTWSGRLDDLLTRETRGTLRSRGEDGGERRLEVALSKIQGGYVDVVPTTPNAGIAQGQSGSVLEVGGRRAGMLLSVEKGVGHVIRADYLESILAAVFVKPGWPTAGRKVCLRHDDATRAVAQALAPAIRNAGAEPMLGCKRPPKGADVMSLTGEETVDYLEDNWIVSVRAAIVLKIAEEREERHRAVRASGSSTLDAARARAAVADDVAEQLADVSLSTFVGAGNRDDTEIGGMQR